MRLTLFTLFSVAATATALPQSAGGFGNGNGVDNQGNTDMRFKVPDDMTVKQAQAKCGNQAQLSCCNKAVYAGGGSGGSGIELFDQCSKLDIQIPILIAIPIQDLVNQNCKQNVACCQTSPSTAVSSAIPLLLIHLANPIRTRIWLDLAYLALVSALSLKSFFSLLHRFVAYYPSEEPNIECLFLTADGEDLRACKISQVIHSVMVFKRVKQGE